MMGKDILLVEPDYYTRFPPLGLLKLASYHRTKGDNIKLIRGCRKINFEPSRIYITSLFTWAWRPVWKAVRYYKKRYPKAEVWLGGIYASLLKTHAEMSGADKVWQGIYPEAEDMMPAYDLIPEWKSTLLFASRGCPRRCGFCSVPILEGQLGIVKNNIRNLIYPGHTKVVFFDNNILATPRWREIFYELIELGIKVDFNQGLDARYINDEVAELLSKMRIDPLIRTAYDYNGVGAFVERAIKTLKEYGFRGRDIMVYILFNYMDSPEDFFKRVREVLDWGAVAYPMRYEPLNTLKKNSYISPKWTKEEVEMVQKARRVLGYGGAFPPYSALIEKFKRAKDFKEAFSLRDPISIHIEHSTKEVLEEVAIEHGMLRRKEYFGAWRRLMDWRKVIATGR
jgi:pyruvate-formate lyase-activating enzyme